MPIIITCITYVTTFEWPSNKTQARIRTSIGDPIFNWSRSIPVVPVGEPGMDTDVNMHSTVIIPVHSYKSCGVGLKLSTYCSRNGRGIRTESESVWIFFVVLPPYIWSHYPEDQWYRTRLLPSQERHVTFLAMNVNSHNRDDHTRLFPAPKLAQIVRLGFRIHGPKTRNRSS